MPIEFSKVWDKQKNCYVYTIQKHAGKDKVGTIKIFDHDGDGIDGNDGFTAQNSSIFSEDELKQNIIEKYRDTPSYITTTINDKEVNLPEVEYREKDSKIAIRNNTEFNLGSFARILRHDYSNPKAQNNNQNNGQNPYQYGNGNNGKNTQLSSAFPNQTYPGLMNLAVNSMTSNPANSIPNVIGTTMYNNPAAANQMTPNMNYNNMAMFQNKWTNILTNMMSMGTMSSDASMMDYQFQMAAMSMMAESNFLFNPNSMYGMNGMNGMYGMNGMNNMNGMNGMNSPYGQNNNIQPNNLTATSGALNDNAKVQPTNLGDTKTVDKATDKTPKDKETESTPKHHHSSGVRHHHYGKGIHHKHVGSAHRRHSTAKYTRRHVTVKHYNKDLRETLEKYYEGKMTSQEFFYATGLHITKKMKNGRVVSTTRENVKDKQTNPKNTTSNTTNSISKTPIVDSTINVKNKKTDLNANAKNPET